MFSRLYLRLGPILIIYALKSIKKPEIRPRGRYVRIFFSYYFLIPILKFWTTNLYLLTRIKLQIQPNILKKYRNFELDSIEQYNLPVEFEWESLRGTSINSDLDPDGSLNDKFSSVVQRFNPFKLFRLLLNSSSSESKK